MFQKYNKFVPIRGSVERCYISTHTSPKMCELEVRTGRFTSMLVRAEKCIVFDTKEEAKQAAFIFQLGGFEQWKKQRNMK